MRLGCEFSPIESNAALAKTYKLIDKLMSKPELSRAESHMLKLLSMLVEQYESREHPTPEVSAADLLAHLLESRNSSAVADDPNFGEFDYL